MEDGRASAPAALCMRLGVGLAQGLALFLLARHGGLSASLWRAALWYVVCCTPFLVLQGVGTMRLWRLLGWWAVAALIAAGLGAYAAWRAPGETAFSGPAGLLLAGLFIAHGLMESADIDRRFVAHYPTYFDVAWKMALQLALVSAFTAVLWLLLWLGAELFALIGLAGLRETITRGWFAYPVTGLAAAAAFHRTDARPELVRGLRGLVLALFSWLLPLLSVLTAAFLGALAFTGLALLWETGRGSTLLLTAAAILILLINAAMQDGRAPRPVLLAHTARLAALLAVPLVLLAGYGLGLRVAQYGWSASRVIGAAVAMVAGFYALGYAAAALRRDSLALLATWNFAGALLVLAVLLALLSPIADPARIAVESQVARLEHHRVTADKFDFAYLRLSGLRFGEAALQRLAHARDPDIRHGAQQALQATAFRISPPIRRQDLAAIIVHPAGRQLPADFRDQPWAPDEGGARLAACAMRHCEALLADLDGDGEDEVLLLSLLPGGDFTAELFRKDHGRWRDAASLPFPHCPGDLEALRAGHIAPVPPSHPDLLLNGRRVQLQWPAPAPACPK